MVDGTADAIAARLPELVAACSSAISALPPADEVILLTAGPPLTGTESAGGTRRAPRVFAPGTLVPSSPLRRSDLPAGRAVALPGAAETGGHPGSGAGPSVGTIVGASLLAERSTPTPPTTAVEVTGDPAAAAALLIGRMSSTHRIGVLVIADGSACHGDAAPGRRDDRAGPFDEALAAALGAGDPVKLGAVVRQRQLAGELQASVDPLAVLAEITVIAPPTSAQLLYYGAPLGVGYLVASWTWGVR